MNTKYLLPHSLKLLGWILLVPGFLLGILFMLLWSGEYNPDFLDVSMFAIFSDPLFSDGTYFSFTKTNLIDEIISILIIVGSLLVVFSKESQEDELISKVRLESLVWAVYVNYAVILFTILFFYGISFTWVFIFNMFTVLLIFIVKFNWAIYQLRSGELDEK